MERNQRDLIRREIECTSSGEQDLISFIRETYGGNMRTNVKCLGNISHKLEIDVLLDELNIGIEYDGLYYHSEKMGKPCDYHLMKTKMAEDMGIRLIHVFENEWMLKKDIVKSRLKNMFGIYDNTIYARKCTVMELNRAETDEFMDRTHIQGKCPSSVNLGLVFDGKVVSAMTFGKPRFNGKYEWELLRFSNELGHHVIGGAGKLLKHFERNYNPSSIISYADRRWSSGGLYHRLGFRHVSDSRPNYWYFKGLDVMSRIRFQKHRLGKLLPKFDEGKTEVQNMLENGYNRIFDCGNMVFAIEYR